MKDLKYPARITEQEEGGYLVEFPDLLGCLTEGDDVKHAKKMAKEALSGYLDSLIEHKEEVPAPSELKGEDIYYITAKLGESTSYTDYHKKSYDKNKDKILQDKKERESALKNEGYKNFREFLHKDTLKKLDKLTKVKNVNRRELLTRLIEKEFEKV